MILKDIVEGFVGKPLKQQLKKYECELEKFTETAEMSLLKKVEFLDRFTSADMPQVIFKLTGFWPSVTIKRFQRFVDHVFEANSSALTHIRVKQGCICVTCSVVLVAIFNFSLVLVLVRVWNFIIV